MNRKEELEILIKSLLKDIQDSNRTGTWLVRANSVAEKAWHMSNYIEELETIED